jgi:signal transduction histidine kinase
MRRAPRQVGTVVLLILALVVTAVLAYQAWDAARSQRVIAERTLRDYAAFADWQLTQQAKNDLLATIMTSLSAPASRVRPDSIEQTVFSPAQVREIARSMVAWCDCLSGVQYFFRYDWHDGTFRTTETGASDADLAWARDTMVAYTKALPLVHHQRTLAFGSPDGRNGTLRNLSVILTNDSYAMLFGERTGKPLLLVFVVSRDVELGRPLVLYGYATDPGSFLNPTFARILDQHSLLPASLTKDLKPDSVLSVSVQTLAGREIYRSPGYVVHEYAAADTIESSFGRLVLRVGIRPGIASQLIVGGLPESRLPTLLALFLLAAGLLSVALVQLRRQQQLARLRTDFVSGVSHELRTPLAQIRWFAELLHMGKLRTEDERARSASIIDQEARRLTYLVENVLTFSRGEKGTSRISPAAVDLDREIDNVVELFGPLTRSRRMSLRATPQAGIVVTVDRDALHQILLNLLDNAVKYGPAGQTITIGSEIAGDRVRLWVEDQGPGIPHEDRQRVWEPYVRLDRPTESVTGGSGIGLAVVRELVSMHGGRTRAEGGPHGGARMVVELPLRDGRWAAGDGSHDVHAPREAEGRVSPVGTE